MDIVPGQGHTDPRGQNFGVNRKALSLYPFVASFKEISLKSDFIKKIHDLTHVQDSPFITLCLGSIQLDRVISERCYNGIIL